MKKTIALLFLIVLSVCIVYGDEPVPAMRPASPDVRSEVPSDSSDYLPNVIKQHDDLQNETTQTTSENGNIDDDEYEYIETDENESENVNENIKPVNEKVNDNTTLENVLEGDKNPINNDATDENVKNNNFTPQTDISNESDTKVKKVKQKKVKSEKPKYGKYNDVENDPYIQTFENEQNVNNEPSKDSQSTVGEGEEVRSKTYSQADYEQAYRDMQVPTFSFVHGVDPDQYYDMKDTTWSPYPLMRLNSPLYFKTITIEPGYYLLTPRKYKDDWFILFKEAGTVKYTIPVFERCFTPANYYRDNLKEYDMTKSARWQIKFLNAWGKYIRKSKRKPATKCNIELTDLANNFLLIELYYGAHKYSAIFRIEKF